MADMYPKNIDKAAEKPEMPWKKGTKMGGMQSIQTTIFRPNKDEATTPPFQGCTEYKSKDGDIIWVPENPKKNDLNRFGLFVSLKSINKKQTIRFYFTSLIQSAQNLEQPIP